MSKYKILPQKYSETSFKRVYDELVKYGICRQIEPVFKKNGEFYDRLNGKIWVEGYGNAYEYCNADEELSNFKYKMSLSNTKRLTNNEMFMVKKLIDRGLGTQELTVLYVNNIDIKNIKTASYRAKNSLLKFKQRNTSTVT